jgi:hypothetical protein
MKCQKPGIIALVREIQAFRGFGVLTCDAVAIVPVTVLPMYNDANSTDTPFHPTYQGEILFANTFSGQLPASDYPKVNVSLIAHATTHSR